MKNKIKITLYSLMFSMLVIGCSDDDDPASSDSCTTHLMAYSENMAGMEDGTMTQAECEAAHVALQGWCADSCEPADTAADDVMCTDDVAAWTTEDITAACEFLIGGGSQETDCNGEVDGDAMIDDCGDCQVAYCYDITTHQVDFNLNEEACNGDTQMWVLPDNSSNPYWNSGCTTTYEFISRFIEGQSSVKYTGQVVRNLLIRDIKANVQDGVSASDLLVFYQNSDATATISTSNSYIAEQLTYHEISDSKLENKIASSSFDFDPGNVIGYDNMTPDALMNEWFSIAAMEGQETSDGVRLDQMIAKGLAGMVSYYQATSVYLHPLKIDVADNTESVNDEYGYTNMEHYWDESFGYFGASIDYLNLENADQRGASDFNGNGSIDYKSEYNFDWAAYAAKRDDCDACDHDGSFATTIMGAYIDGREAISNDGSMLQADEYRTIIVNTWEKVVAANIIHYANEVQADIANNDSDLNKHWSEMRAFALALQFNYYKQISDSDLETIIDDMGNVPQSSIEYSLVLDNIKTMLGDTYGFGSNDLLNW